MKTKQSSPYTSPMLFMFLMPAIVIIIMSFICGDNHYSPLDEYIKTTIERDSLNKASYNDAVKFIDSINNK